MPDRITSHLTSPTGARYTITEEEPAGDASESGPVFAVERDGTTGIISRRLNLGQVVEDIEAGKLDLVTAMAPGAYRPAQPVRYGWGANLRRDLRESMSQVIADAVPPLGPQDERTHTIMAMMREALVNTSYDVAAEYLRGVEESRDTAASMVDAAEDERDHNRAALETANAQIRVLRDSLESRIRQVADERRIVADLREEVREAALSSEKAHVLREQTLRELATVRADRDYLHAAGAQIAEVERLHDDLIGVQKAHDALAEMLMTRTAELADARKLIAATTIPHDWTKGTPMAVHVRRAEDVRVGDVLTITGTVATLAGGCAWIGNDEGAQVGFILDPADRPSITVTVTRPEPDLPIPQGEHALIKCRLADLTRPVIAQRAAADRDVWYVPGGSRKFTDADIRRVLAIYEEGTQE